ncbi:unnamed protein product, partial [Laminaria digitata]
MTRQPWRRRVNRAAGARVSCRRERNTSGRARAPEYVLADCTTR